MRAKSDLLIPDDPPVAGGTSRPDCKYGYCDIGTGAVEAKYSSSTCELSTMSLFLDFLSLLLGRSPAPIGAELPDGRGVADRDGLREEGAFDN